MRRHGMTATALVALAFAACDGNPTAIADLNLAVEIEIEAARAETFVETPVHIRLIAAGTTQQLRQGQLEVRHAGGGDPVVYALTPHDGGYETNAFFFAEGDHHLHVVGVLEGHALMAELGEDEAHVHAQRQLIGPYWVELDLVGPIFEDEARHVHVRVYDVLPDDTRGAAVGGLAMHMAMHRPDGTESELTVTEDEPGVYAAEFDFGHAGHYELHVEIEVAGVHEEGEFHVPVHTPDMLSGDAGGDEGGHEPHGH